MASVMAASAGSGLEQANKQRGSTMAYVASSWVWGRRESDRAKAKESFHMFATLPFRVAAVRIGPGG